MNINALNYHTLGIRAHDSLAGVMGLMTRNGSQQRVLLDYGFELPRNTSFNFSCQ